VHSSTVTVAVLDASNADVGAFRRRDDGDYQIEWFSGTGCGGQHRNKHQNSARITHLPTGVTRSAQTRSRENSLRLAMQAINEELDRQCGHVMEQAENSTRKDQVGSGERSDKRRTVRFQHDEVIDHITGKRMTAKDYMKGGMEKLW
jgi:peptide chain release factor 1